MMNNTFSNSLKKTTISLITSTISFFLVCTVLGLVVWSISQVWQHPIAGAFWSYTTGEVFEVDPSGPSHGILLIGDKILSIDGSSVWDTGGFPGYKSGDEIIIVLERNGNLVKAQIKLTSPDIITRIDRLSPIILGLCFWLLGFLILIFYWDNKRWVTFLYTQTACLILISGSLSSFGPVWISLLFHFLLFWAGPLAVHTHFILAGQTYRKTKRLLAGLYIISAFFSILEIYGQANVGIGKVLDQTVSYTWLGINFILIILGSIVIYIRQRRQTSYSDRIGILPKLIIAGILPISILTILPQVLFGKPVIPYEISFIFFSLIPLGYGITIFKGRLLLFDQLFSRSLKYFIVFFALAIIFIFTYYSFIKIFAFQDHTLLLSFMVVLLVLVAASKNIYRWISTVGEFFYYGEAYDYQETIQDIEKILQARKNDSTQIGSLLCQSLCVLIHVEFVGILLPGGKLIIAAQTKSSGLDFFELKTGVDFLTLNQETTSFTNQGIRIFFNKISDEFKTEQPKISLMLRKAEVLLPLLGNSDCVGILFLGHRKGMRGYDDVDMSILKSVAIQARMAIENNLLWKTAEDHSILTRRMSQQIILARENERKSVARELHDRIIQPLVGLNYELSTLRNHQDNNNEKITIIQDNLRKLSQDLRRICSDLRPPALDYAGLVPALRSRISELRQQNIFDIDISVVGDKEMIVPEQISICLYRVFQEAIQNIQKHSHAGLVDVILNLEPEQITLTILDNGVGFQPPKKIGELIENHHFGLAGLEEMLEAVEGKLYIDSDLGQGCSIEAVVALSFNRSEII